MTTNFTVKGTHCAACKALIEDVCRDFPEVVSCTVDYQTGLSTIEHSEPLDMEKIIKEIEGLGQYTVVHQ